jgi:hypothetical protein
MRLLCEPCEGALFVFSRDLVGYSVNHAGSFVESPAMKDAVPKLANTYRPEIFLPDILEE